MRRISFLGLAAMAATVAVAAPAQAKHHQPTGSTGPIGSTGSPGKKCEQHKTAFVVSGTLVSGSLTADPGTPKTASGTLTVLVTKTNRHAAGNKGQTETYTLSHAIVSFSSGVNTTSPAAGSRVKLQGTITAVAPKCSQAGFTPTITITKVEIHRAKTPKP